MLKIISSLREIRRRCGRRRRSTRISSNPALSPGEELTPTELQILHLLCADKSNAEVAQIMDVKLPTVKTHVSHILEKLDVKRRAEAKTAAKKLHLVPEEL